MASRVAEPRAGALVIAGESLSPALCVVAAVDLLQMEVDHQPLIGTGPFPVTAESCYCQLNDAVVK